MLDFGIPIEVELALGAVLVMFGANLLEKAAVGLACVLKRAYAVGAVLLALSGNLPEFAVSASAIMAGKPDLAVSSIIGSVAVNILLVIGLSGILGARKKDLEFDSKKLQADIPLLIGAMGFFIFLNLERAPDINVLDGVLLLLTYVLLLRFILYSHKEVYSSAEAHENVEGSLGKYVGMFIVAAVFVALGAEMLVSGVETIFIDQMHWDEKFVGFTILALAANLPEHMAAIKAAINKNNNSLFWEHQIWFSR